MASARVEFYIKSIGLLPPGLARERYVMEQIPDTMRARVVGELLGRANARRRAEKTRQQMYDELRRREEAEKKQIENPFVGSGSWW